MSIDRALLSTLLKAKANNKKSINQLIDEFIADSASLAKRDTKAFTDKLLVFVSDFDGTDIGTLKQMVDNKISELNIKIPPYDMEAFYKRVGQNIAQEIKKPFSFDSKDVDSIQATRSSFQFMLTDGTKKTQDKLKGVINDVFGGKIDRLEVAKRLKEEFKGVVDGTQHYFGLVADQVISQSQNMSIANQALTHGVKHFRVTARLDDRTSVICRSMNGRIIPAQHIRTQIAHINSATTISSKKQAAKWYNTPFFGKDLPSDLGTPPYHARCRTQILPVFENTEVIDGKQITYYGDKHKDSLFEMVDKTGVQRRLSKSNWNNHIKANHPKITKKDIIAGLNSIQEIAPQKDKPLQGRIDTKRFVAKTQSDLFIVLDGDEIVTAFRPNKKLDKYFRDDAKMNERSIIKWLLDIMSV